VVFGTSNPVSRSSFDLTIKPIVMFSRPPALSQSMRCVSAALIVLNGAAVLLLGAACAAHQAEDVTCPRVTSPYSASDVMLRLQTYDNQPRQRALRLPLGKVVTAPAKCSDGDALELLTRQSAPTSSAPVTAFKAVKVGQAHLYWHPACGGEVCMMGFDADITVTDGCQMLPPAEVIKLVVTPLSYPQGQTPPAPRSVAAKLTTVTRYAEVFGDQVDLSPDQLLWVVLVDEPQPPTQDPTQHVWYYTAVDACTNWRSFGGSNATVPAGWSSLVDLSVS
jgi:hypothetical protein